MTMFQFAPPRNNHHANLDILRTPPAKKTGGIIVNSTMHGLPIHFHGRSIPCTQTDDCPVCARGNAPRWTGYLGVWGPAWVKPRMLELPTGAADQVASYVAAHGRILHKCITVWRPKRTANGPVEVTIRANDVEGLNIPNEPDIPAALCVLWGLKKDDIQGSLIERMKSFDRYALQSQTDNGATKTEHLRVTR